MLSVITTTYNHAATIERTVCSLLAQHEQDWEHIIVSDGATYDVAAVTAKFHDPRIRLVIQPVNRGPNFARNAGLDAVRGDWFTFLDDDDELTGPDALGALVAVPGRVDRNIDAVTCNVVDGTTGQWTGLGFDHDQYLSWQTVLTHGHGEFWGITKTSLLQGERFIPDIRGYENVFWHRLDKRACRYYIHQACRIWHTEEPNRISREKVTDLQARERIYRSFRAILEEKEYLVDIARYDPESYMATLFAAGLSFVRARDHARAARVLRRALHGKHHLVWKAALLGGTLLGPSFLDILELLKRL